MATYKCVKCGVRFEAMNPQAVRQATGGVVEHCGTPAQWVRS